MSKILQSMAVLVLALVGLVGCDYEATSSRGCESSPCGGDEADLSRSLARAHLLGAARRVEQRDEQSGGAGCRREGSRWPMRNRSRAQVTPFYGEAASEKFFSLLGITMTRLKNTPRPPSRGMRHRQDAALARLRVQCRRLCRIPQRSQSPPAQRSRSRPDRGAWSPPCPSNQPVQEKGICAPRGNLDDDATTRLCHCGYADDGIGEAVSGQVLMTGE